MKSNQYFIRYRELKIEETEENAFFHKILILNRKYSNQETTVKNVWLRKKQIYQISKNIFCQASFPSWIILKCIFFGKCSIYFSINWAFPEKNYIKIPKIWKLNLFLIANVVFRKKYFWFFLQHLSFFLRKWHFCPIPNSSPKIASFRRLKCLKIVNYFFTYFGHKIVKKSGHPFFCYEILKYYNFHDLMLKFEFKKIHPKWHFLHSCVFVKTTFEFFKLDNLETIFLYSLVIFQSYATK